MLLIVFELAGTTSRYAHPSRERLREAVDGAGKCFRDSAAG